MSTAYPDLPAAMIGWLRAQPTIVAAIGEDTSSPATTKFHADEAQTAPQPPWAVYEETNAATTWMTAAGGARASIEDATIRWTVVAASKSQARQLGKMIARALNDAPLVFADGQLMAIFETRKGWLRSGDVAPGSPVVYVYAVEFSVTVQRSTATP